MAKEPDTPVEKKTNPFVYGAAFSALLFIPLFVYAANVYIICTDLKPDFPWPMRDLTEFRKVLYSAGMCIITKKAVNQLLRDFFAPYVKNQDDPVLKQKRINKATKYVWSLSYFLFVVYLGWNVLQDSPWLPWYLGGSEKDLKNCFYGTPWVKPLPGAVDYALIQLGYHMGDLISHGFIDERHNDYHEFLMHHICSFALTLCMLISNDLSVGCIVLFCHDIADIWCMVMRITTSIQGLDALTAALWIFFSGSWFYTRNLCFTWIVYNIWFVHNRQERYQEPQLHQHNLHKDIAAVFLTFLVMLQWYWIYLIVGMFTNFFKTGQAEDLQSNVTQKVKQN